VPWQEVACDMHDAVKHNSSGYASFNYEEAGYLEADLVKVEIVVNGEVCEPLSFIVHTEKAVENGRKIAQKLKDVLARQQFEIIVQARIGLKVTIYLINDIYNITYIQKFYNNYINFHI
jgi:GTP-binding protein LepA